MNARLDDESVTLPYGVTVTESVAVFELPPMIVKLHDPCAAGVTVNVVPLAGEIVAMPLHVVVEAVNEPV